MDNGFYDGKRLDIWLSQQEVNSFPNSTNYFQRYEGILNWLKVNVYNQITATAMLAEIETNKKPIYLNKHGLGHVEMVICRATELIYNTCELLPYEVYMLLVAILIHDVGNVFGRENHEKACHRIVYALGTIMGDDSTEKRIIEDIAQAHGGYMYDSKDTIYELETVQIFHSRDIRMQLLASILRFADELADDRTRAEHVMTGLIDTGDSELHHAYSHSLHSVSIDGRDIKLSYELSKAIALKLYNKDGQSVYLIDEILQRILKMFLELLYCRKYSHSKLIVNRIVVKIEVFDDFTPVKPSKRLIDPISFDIQEKGYPTKPKDGIFELCPKIRGLNGASIKKQLEGLAVS